MKKSLLTLFIAFMLGFVTYAQAQDVHKNPISFYINQESVNVKIGVADKQVNYLPADTVMPLSEILFAVATEANDYVVPENKDTVFLTVSETLKTYYNYVVFNGDYSITGESLEEAEYCESSSHTETNIVGQNRAGVYKWKFFVVSRPELGASGTVQFNRDAKVSFGSKGPNKDGEIYNTQKFSLNGKVYSGYPYDVKKYQGNCRVKVYDPDDIMIKDINVLMEASNDSVKLEYLKEFDICEVDSAKEGNYRVEMYPCWTADTVRYVLSVTNPLNNATTKDPADATYRFKNMSFNKDEMNVWKNIGKPLTVVNTEAGNAVIVKKEDADDDESFNVSQTVAKMPKGWYGLKWKGYYQPTTLDSVKVADPVLAKIYGGSTEQCINHVFDAFRVSYNDGYYEKRMPSTNETIARELANSQASMNIMNFEVGEDSIVTIGAKASVSKRIGALTALGPVTLEYYGKGLPYGTVVFGQDKYNAEDSIKVVIDLFDGPGAVVPADNKIVVVMCAGTVFDEKKIIDAQEIDAPKAGNYCYKTVVPKSEEFTNGSYTIFVTSINMDGAYQLKESQTIELTGGKADPSDVKTPVSAAKVNTGVAYDVAGRVVNAKTAKGIIIVDGKKSVR